MGATKLKYFPAGQVKLEDDSNFLILHGITRIIFHFVVFGKF